MDAFSHRFTPQKVHQPVGGGSQRHPFDPETIRGCIPSAVCEYGFRYIYVSIFVMDPNHDVNPNQVTLGNMQQRYFNTIHEKKQALSRLRREYKV